MKNVFIYKPQVQATDIDNFGHVNNEVYLRWLIEAAVEHSHFVGYPLQRFLEMNSAFVVRRHELEYLLPVFLKDQLRIETWTTPMLGSRAIRNYEIYNEASNGLVLSGMTTWVFVNLQNGRPMKIPTEVTAAFANFQSNAGTITQT